MPSRHSFRDTAEDISDSEEDVAELSEGKNLMEPNDSMTLVQYQSSHRKEALTRKSTQIQVTSHKKGRVVTEGIEP